MESQRLNITEALLIVGSVISAIGGFIHVPNVDTMELLKPLAHDALKH